MDVVSDAVALKPGTQWMGTCIMQSDGSNFPIIMRVDERKANAFSGTIQWPTLNSAKTKFKGTIKGDDITFEEYEVVTGQDDVEVPMKYVGRVNGNSITGKNEHPDEECASTFKMDKLVSKPAKGLT